MFGLMRARSCGRDRQRLYCGTCKTLGRLYGQPTRLLLNHDAVFLGELLSALTPTPNWAPAFTPRRCTTLPRADEVPPALAYAATVNVILAEFKVADRVRDLSRIYSGVRLALHRPFLAAHRRLAAEGFPIDALWRQIDEQEARERAPGGRTLDDFAEPTAAATRLVFGQGATVIGRPEHQPSLAAVGDAFGRLVYVLDAAQDRDDDRRRGAFNAADAAGVDAGALRRYLLARQQDIANALDALPIGDTVRHQFVSRLRASVAHAVGAALPMSDPPRPVRSGGKRERRTRVARRRSNGRRSCCDGCSGDCWLPCHCCSCSCDAVDCACCGETCCGGCDSCCCCGASA